MAIFSYDGGLTFGVTGDYDEAPDIDVLCRGIEESLRELVEAAERESDVAGARPEGSQASWTARPRWTCSQRGPPARGDGRAAGALKDRVTDIAAVRLAYDPADSARNAPTASWVWRGRSI